MKILIAFFAILLCAKSSLGLTSLEKGNSYFAKGNFTQAATEYITEDRKEKLLHGRYNLGLSLIRLKLPFLAAIPFMTVATQGKDDLQKKALDKLVKISSDTKDNSILNYSINKLTVADLEETSDDIYYNLLAEYNDSNGQFAEALKYAEKVLQKNPDNEKALFLAGTLHLKLNNPEKAAGLFKYLASYWQDKPANNELKGITLANYARALYQSKKFSEAESIYRQIPKDHMLYRKVQMELAWTLFRAGKTRSALSALQTLHTPYYENFYNPESFILRAIILIFACQGDEAMKSTLAFENNFKNLKESLDVWISKNNDPATVTKEILIAQKKLTSKKDAGQGALPFFVVRTLMDEKPLRSLLQAKKNILKEQLSFKQIFKNHNNTQIQNYANKAYSMRINNLDKNIARIFNSKITIFRKDYLDFSSQIDFLKYEILEEKKRTARNKIKESKKLDEANARDFYVQNGYRYWPFNGEYWIDDIGNYQYLGVNRCED